MKKYPNTSIFNLITQKEGNTEKLIFIYIKPVSDFYTSDNIHWYPQRGNKGEANFIWEKLGIKQWVACGKDDVILDLFENILESSKITIGDKEILLRIPSFKKILHENSELKSRSETISDNLNIEDSNQIPQEFYQKENLEILSGYTISDRNIKPLYPLGFFENNFIFNNLQKNIFGIKEYRTSYLTFRGIRKTAIKNLGSTEMVGFYQQNFIEENTYSIKIENVDDELLGQNFIDKTNGFFKIILNKPTDEGKLEISANKNIERSVKYTLIRDISIDMNIANTTFKDAYGRNFMISSKEKDKVSKLSNFTWQRDVYADTNEADKKLSDKFKELFENLGPKVLIVDPYYINEIKQDNVTNEFTLKHCQIAFMNAMIHSSILGKVKSINILGNNSRANNHLTLDPSLESTKTEQRFNNYEKLLKGLITSNKIQSYFPSGKISFRSSKVDFHNRYWFSITEKDGIEILEKCVIITNSIGNMNEVDIMIVEDEAQLNQITRKYYDLLKNSDIKLTI